MFKKFAIIIMTLVICGCICGCAGNADVDNANEMDDTTIVEAEQNDYIIVKLYEENGLWHVYLDSRTDESIPGIGGCYDWKPSEEDFARLWNSRIQNWNEIIGD